MRRLILTIAVFVGLLAPVAAGGASAWAADAFQACSNDAKATNTDVCQDAREGGGDASSNTNPIINIIKAAIDVLSYLIGAAAIIGIVVSGVRLMTSGGNSESVASARSGLIYSLIGVFIVAIAQFLVAYVLNKIGN